MKSLYNTLIVLLIPLSILANDKTVTFQVNKIEYYGEDSLIESDFSIFENGQIVEHYVSRTVEYPRRAQYNGIEGVVWVRFDVTEKGNVTKVKIIKSVHPLLDEATLSCIKSLPALKIGGQTREQRSDLQLAIRFIIDG